MNIDAFEKQTTQTSHHEDSSTIDETHAIKQKIKERKTKQRKLKVIFGLFISIIIVLTSAVVYSQYKLHLLAQEESLSESNAALPKTGEEVVKALARHILLPEGVPQIAEVQDAAKLKESQAFFKDVETGDIVVVYDSTIFVYRPSKDIVVASGDISGVGQLKP